MSPLLLCCSRRRRSVSSRIADFPKGVGERPFSAQRQVVEPPRSSERGADWSPNRTWIGGEKSLVGYVDFYLSAQRSELK